MRARPSDWRCFYLTDELEGWPGGIVQLTRFARTMVGRCPGLGCAERLGRGVRDPSLGASAPRIDLWPGLEARSPRTGCTWLPSRRSRVRGRPIPSRWCSPRRHRARIGALVVLADPEGNEFCVRVHAVRWCVHPEDAGHAERWRGGAGDVHRAAQCRRPRTTGSQLGCGAAPPYDRALRARWHRASASLFVGVAHERATTPRPVSMSSVSTRSSRSGTSVPTPSSCSLVRRAHLARPPPAGQARRHTAQPRQRPIDAKHLLAALTPRTGQRHRRVAWHRQQKRRMRRERRGPHTGPVTHRRLAQDHQPPVAVRCTTPSTNCATTRGRWWSPAC